MAGQIARGLNDAKLFPIDAAGALGAALDIPGTQSLAWSADADTDELEGDDTIIARSIGAKSGDATLTVGKLSLPVLAAMQGGTVATTGVAPNTVTKLDETGQGSVLAFALKAQANARDGGAYRVTLWNCQAQSPSEELGQSAYNTPSIGIVFQENDLGILITREQFETAAAIS